MNKTLLRRRTHSGISAFRPPNEGLESRFCRWRAVSAEEQTEHRGWRAVSANRGWRAVSAAGLLGKSLRERNFFFADTGMTRTLHGSGRGESDLKLKSTSVGYPLRLGIYKVLGPGVNHRHPSRSVDIHLHPSTFVST